MKLKEADLKLIALKFNDLTVGKYKLAVIEKNEEEYLFDLSSTPADGFDFLVMRALLTSLNSVISPEELVPMVVPQKTVLRKRNQDPHCYRSLWDEFTKKVQ